MRLASRVERHAECEVIYATGHHDDTTNASTCIIATLGPASSDADTIGQLIDAGVNVFRLNFSHGEHAVHVKTLEAIRQQASRTLRPIGILQDLQGPKIRTLKFTDGRVDLVAGQKFLLTCDDRSLGDENRVGVTYAGLCKDVGEGSVLLLDDGRLSLEVEARKGATLVTRVVRGGILSNNKGINAPGCDLGIPALADKDVEDMRVGAELGVDWVAMSFVRSRDDVFLARHYLDRNGSNARLMAKIEKPSAVDRFSEILAAADGIMIARGDLGVEMSAEQVPIIQKRLIRECREAGKPVVTATQSAPGPARWARVRLTAATRETCFRPPFPVHTTTVSRSAWGTTVRESLRVSRLTS